VTITRADRAAALAAVAVQREDAVRIGLYPREADDARKGPHRKPANAAMNCG